MGDEMWSLGCLAVRNICIVAVAVTLEDYGVCLSHRDGTERSLLGCVW